MLITDEYRELNRQLHDDRADYGIVGQRYAEQVKQAAEATDALTLLDYGCGKQTLSRALPQFAWTDYDPCIAGLDERPGPADMVVSTDVLEHIEPECLDEVLDDIKGLARKAVFLTVATRPAKKFLADGRNAHLIVEPPWWWLERIGQRFHAHLFHGDMSEFMFFGTPK